MTKLQARFGRSGYEMAGTAQHRNVRGDLVFLCIFDLTLTRRESIDNFALRNHQVFIPSLDT